MTTQGSTTVVYLSETTESNVCYSVHENDRSGSSAERGWHGLEIHLFRDPGWNSARYRWCLPLQSECSAEWVVRGTVSAAHRLPFSAG